MVNNRLPYRKHANSTNTARNPLPKLEFLTTTKHVSFNRIYLKAVLHIVKYKRNGICSTRIRRINVMRIL